MTAQKVPNEQSETAPVGKVITFGLSEEQNELVGKSLPTKQYELFDTNAPTDLLALSASAIIIHAAALRDDDREMFLDYYDEVGDCTDETVFWIGEPKPPKSLTKVFRCHDTFETFAANLQYHLLSAHRRSQKARKLSGQLGGCLQILALIRANPYIRTQELAEKLELPVRRIQRYIAAMRDTGEWIEYDREKRGWYLQEGKSLFFGDV